jgi:hypothetical protein
MHREFREFREEESNRSVHNVTCARAAVLQITKSSDPQIIEPVNPPP